METLRFLTPKIAAAVRKEFGTPVYVYDERTLRNNAQAMLQFPNAFGLTVRYAMKSSPNAAILQTFQDCGLHIDASSGHECERAMRAGIPAGNISLSAQELPENFADLVRRGVTINACSLSQLERFGKALKGHAVGLRFNPGVGSGGTKKTNVGGPSSSFGIWHEWLPQVKALVRKYRLRVFRIHTHIGSGSDPTVWQHVSELSLGLVREFPDVTVLNLGGGYKVGRMSYEKTTDLQDVGAPVKEAFEDFARETGRELHLEIEPGTWLVANSCSLVSTIQDLVHTGDEGFHFLKLDTGMTEILRPSLYGSQHPLILLPRKKTDRIVPYVAVGHCCESGDLITPAPDAPDVLATRELPEAQVGDLCVIEGAGAYCAGMNAKNYNAFPEAPEVLLRQDRSLRLIRKRQTLDQILANELPLRPAKKVVRSAK